MPRYGKYIKGDYTKVKLNGEVVELYYKDHLIASADPIGITIYPFKAVASQATYENRLTEFFKEFFPQARFGVEFGEHYNSNDFPKIQIIIYLNYDSGILIKKNPRVFLFPPISLDAEDKKKFTKI